MKPRNRKLIHKVKLLVFGFASHPMAVYYKVKTIRVKSELSGMERVRDESFILADYTWPQYNTVRNIVYLLKQNIYLTSKFGKSIKN